MYINSEVTSFLMCILMGMGIGVLFDAFRIIRKIVVHNNIVVIVQDFIFCILSGIYLFYIMYVLNSGQFRFYMLLGIIFSNVIYFMIVSKYLVGFFVYIFTPLKNLLQKITIKNK